MSRILSQCIKELAQFRRDRLTLALAFVLPFLTLLIFGFAIRLEAKDIGGVIRIQILLANSKSDRDLSYSQVLSLRQGWIDKVKRSQTL